jgi:hypothetical protein
MNVVINGETITFNPFRPVHHGTAGKYYCDSQKRYFLKQKVNGNHINPSVLELLKKYDRHFPKLVTHFLNYIVTEFIHGEILTAKNKPSDLREQMMTILDILAKEKIYHGDIHQKQFIVSNGLLMIVDFENSFIYGPVSPSPPRLSRFKMRRWIKTHPDYCSINKQQMMRALGPFL